MSTKVLIVDDHPVTRAGIQSVLEIDDSLQIIGEASDGLEAIQKAVENKPDVIVMDVSMPQVSGIEATRTIVKKSNDIKILALSIHAGDEFVKGMLDAGAVGYMLKDEAPDELIRAIQVIDKGEMYLSPGVTKAALSKDEVKKQSSDNLVLNSKLFRPRIMPDFVIRARIIEELEQNIVNPLTLVSAGAGYGKSICISQWLGQTAHFNAWISLDQDIMI